MTYGGYHFLLLSSFLITAIAIADVIYTIAVANAIVGVIGISSLLKNLTNILRIYDHVFVVANM
jgi:hypothetical protein